MKKLVIFGALALMVMLAPVESASAHVFVPDETKVRGAIVHITPDDDPIAGQKATIYFDVQDSILKPDSTVALVIQGEGSREEMTAKFDDSLATFAYTFPSQGVYELVFSVNTGSNAYTFKQSHRVARGAAVNALDQPSHEWARITLLASGIGFALMLITVINRRREIAKQSTF